MLKWTGLVTTGTALVLVVPAATLGGGQIDTLEQALSGTVKALGVLAGLQQGLAQASPAAVAALRSVTEEPLPDGEQRSELLANLRGQLALLASELDTLEGRVAGGGSALPWIQPARPADPATKPPLDSAQALVIAAEPGVTRGLDPATRTLVGRIGFPSPSERAAATPTPEPSSPVDSASYAGYSADSLRQAQAAYRARDYARAIALLEPLGKDPTALYWLARSHEKLGRLERAEALYKEVIAIGAPGSETERARTDLEFLTWKRRFETDPPAGEAPAASAPGGARP